ncbi:MAG: alpha/beta fold hydrolase [Acidimicrobiia bacterium]
MSLARPPQQVRLGFGPILLRIVGLALLFGVLGGMVWSYLAASSADRYEVLTPTADPPGEIVTLSNGQAVHYRSIGSGAPVLLIHGFDLAGGYQWLSLAEELSGFRLIIPDQVDFGYSGRPAGNGQVHTVFGRAETMLAFLDHLEIESAAVVGAGLGGTVAAQMVVNNSAMIDRLVLVSAEIYGPADDWTATFYGLPVVGKALNFTSYGGGGRAVLNYERECASGGFCPTSEDHNARQIGAAMAGTSDALAAMSATPGAVTVPADLPAIGLPTLVIWGDEDLITPLADGRRLAEQIEGATVEVIPGAGHQPHRQDPAATAGLIAAFLAS